CRPVGDGVKRRAHDADLKEMVVIRSPSPQLVPFKLHRFGQQRHLVSVTLILLTFAMSAYRLSHRRLIAS
ncbi:hypothetical protein OB952_18395, partial [Aeromonas salmonicida]|nr:hypothetical protein [Aeromonas salmonicida]